ncbi:MAG: UDP-N-acetylmuramoyl-L-alanyl-D-glutamate--2,6-diaminopimelate ligase [Helicobacteraceae bacterium]|jgi:UDP-N-acetylmuramoyl-L-alanyl-D-glutamate--2,6-diaminopimelate ligase|nr:UDP-N-acetylmuramoyl-L-alanyl-D-glutamate--2,6-diaminopimelate ligase [Helicobacteraceae bacterium]
MKYPVSSDRFKFVSSDSRECDAQTAFVVDWYSRKFLDDAVKNGAAAVLQAGDLGEYFDVNMPIVGISGTNGKTTIAALIYSFLLDLGYSVAMQGTRGFFIDGRSLAPKLLTTPVLLENYARIDCAKKRGCDFFITEISSHAIAQGRAEGLKFALKVHSNITGDHLDFHRLFEEYRRVKNSFFADETPKIINKDDPQIEFNFANARTYAIEAAAAFKLEAYSQNDGLSGAVVFSGERAIFNSNLIGRFNLYNILAAIGAVKTLTDKPLQTICDLVENFGGVAGRMEIVSQKPLVIVDFAHTQDGIEKVLEALLPRKIVAVFGAGGDRDKSKRAPMGAEAAKRCVKIYLTSDNPRSEDPLKIIEEIRIGCGSHPNVFCIADRKEAIAKALENLASDEILVILGKGDETTQTIGETVLPFSDREIVLELLKGGAA